MFVGWVIIIVLVAIGVRLIAGSMDRPRIEREIESRGGRVRSITWAPLGKGWFAEKNDRIYEVEYVDRNGRARSAWCKTSMLSGVYFSENDASGGAGEGERDRVGGGGSEQQAEEEASLRWRIKALEAENRRLKAREGEPPE